MRRQSDMLIHILVALFIVHTLLLSSFTLFRTHQVITGRAAGQLELCLNTLPALNMSNCSSSINQSDLYWCWANATDPDGDTIIFTADFLTNNTLFNMSTGGMIRFVPDNDDVGLHLVNITADDNACPSQDGVWALLQIRVNNSNDPPYLNVSIEDQTVPVSTELRTFYLDDHFADPDNDLLEYNKSITNKFNVSILDTSQVSIRAMRCPAKEYIQFYAEDPYEASAESNLVQLECTQEEGDEDDPGTSPQQQQSGGGGGGGGATTCIPKLVCTPWEKCQPDGTMRRKCFDEHGCKQGMWYLHKECNYIEQCNNGVQDWNEEGVDCGGPCPACPTCHDGIMNGGESGIDCGGPCPKCVLSRILFAELKPIGEDEEGQVVRKWQLSILNQQSKQIKVLESGFEQEPEARFSRNGTRAYYVKDGDIWEKNLKNMTTKRLTNNEDVMSIADTEDGMLYTKQWVVDNNNYPQAFLMDRETLTKDQLVLNNPVYELDSMYNRVMSLYAKKGIALDYRIRGYKKSHPDYIFGKVVLPDKSTITIIDRNRKPLLEIEHRDNDLFGGRFSPNGNMISYFSHDGYQADLWLISTDGNRKIRLTDTGQYNEVYPVFSPDRMLYTADYKGKYAIYSMAVDGSNQSLVLESPNPVIAFDWHYSPSCFDGLRNQDETRVDCGGMCGPCGTCFDGIKNQNEEGIDCGGVCPPCKYVEQPTQLTAQDRTFMYVSAGTLLLLIVLGIIFRERLAHAWLALWYRIKGRETRQILISDELKKDILERISKLEKDLEMQDVKESIVHLTQAGRKYFAAVLKLSQEFDYEEAKGVLEKSRVKGMLKLLLDELLDDMNDLEFGKDELGTVGLRTHMEVLRWFVIMTSRNSPDDLKREQYEPKPKDSREKILLDAREILVALEYDEIALAKKKYAELNKTYSRYSDKASVYRHVKQAYDSIRYYDSVS